VREWSPSEANLDVLYRISEEVVRPSVSLDQLLKRILDLTLEAVRADRGVMFVADSRTDRIDPRVVSVREGMSVSDRVPVSRTIVEYVIQNGEGIQTTDASHDERFEEGQSIVKAGIREAMCVPIRGRYELLGVIYVDITTSSVERIALAGRQRFSRELLTLLAAIGRQSALAVENHRFQEALVAAERLAAVGQAIAGLGHDIKNILQGMKGGSYLIDQGLQQTDDTLVRKGWGIVERNQDRIFNLVMDMLSFSKDRPPKLKSADVNETVREVCDLIQPGAEEQGTRIQFEPDQSIPTTLFDPDAMHRAVLNIVSNALHAVDGVDEGCVRVITSHNPSDHTVSVLVSDNGPGIPAEELPHLFNLFHSSKGSRGTGLGLAVSQKILREHGGEIGVESPPGAGATFRLTWPMHEEEAEGSSVNRATV
jgi:two-component system NtrC family sensor kinase